jgi:hypothetical protein
MARNLHIVKFIQSLNAIEIQIIDDYLQSIYLLSNSKKKESKQLMLFRYISSNKEKLITDNELIKNTGIKDIYSQKYSLSIKIYDALLLSKHLENKEIFNDREQIVFSLKKKILLIKSLRRSSNQGRMDTLNLLLTETIRLAKENQVYDVLVEALIQKKQINGIRLGPRIFENTNKEIFYYELCFKCVQNANDVYYRLILNKDFINSFSTIKLDSYLKNSIKKLTRDYKKTKAHEVNYYLHILRLEYYEQTKEYQKGIKYCNMLITLLRKSKIMFSKNRIGIALNTLSQFSIYAKKYKDGVLNAQKAQRFFIKNNLNYLLSKELEFYAYMYSYNYKDAYKCIEEMLQHSMTDTGEFRKSKYIYFKACILFATKQYQFALELLNKSLEIEKDKSKWNISLRILIIMVFLELNKINEVGRLVEALRKYIERNKKTDIIAERYILIVKLLRELEKNGYEFNSGNNTATKILKMLAQKNTPLSWNYYTPEIIPFHKWIMDKKTHW